MEQSRQKEIKHHLSEEEIDELLREAEDDHRLRRLGFVKNLYQGDSIPEAAPLTVSLLSPKSPACGRPGPDQQVPSPVHAHTPAQGTAVYRGPVRNSAICLELRY